MPEAEDTALQLRHINMRVALVAVDDAATASLRPLKAQGCEVLCIGGGGSSCAVFARQCLELGFDFLRLSNGAVAGLMITKFAPDLLIIAAGAEKHFESLQLPPADAADVCRRSFAVRAGLPALGAPWPEFAPLFLGHEVSRVSLVNLASKEEEVSIEVKLAPGETAISLRAKHEEVAAKLLSELLDGTHEKAGAAAAASTPSTHGVDGVDAMPTRISLAWDEATVDRYIRAHYLPPCAAAVVANPADEGEEYYIESMAQYKEFRAKVLQEHSVGSGSAPLGPGPCRMYAADTHWYSNVGGSIVKMGDANVHMPVRTTEQKKRAAMVPGASITGRKKLRMNEPLIGMNAERYCAGALDSGWIGVEGPYVKRLERQLAEICGCQAACAVQSGTAALYGAMKALGVSGPSHHVLVPAFTCAAAADAVVHAGGLPVPVDCELDSYGISLESVRAVLEANRNVVGVVLAPCYGVPARDMFEILTLCRERGLWICEDACETYGSVQALPPQDGDLAPRLVPVGSLATLCVVSVRSEKMIGVGEGGAILGNDTTLVAKAKWWCSRAPTRGAGLWCVYEHDAVGQNFRLPEILAAVGSAAAEMLPTMLERKRSIHEWYASKVAAHPELKGVKLQKAGATDEPVWWINAALLPEGLNGEEVGMRLMRNCPDIEIRPGFYPLNKMEIFKSEWGRSCPNAELLYDRLVCLPSSNQLTEADIDRVCGALGEALQQVRAKA